MKYIIELIVLAIIAFSVGNFWIGLILGIVSMVILNIIIDTISYRFSDLENKNVIAQRRIKELEQKIHS